MNDIKHMRWNFYSVAWAMPEGRDLGVPWGGGGVGGQIFFPENHPDLVCELLT